MVFQKAGSKPKQLHEQKRFGGLAIQPQLTIG
jgi:hypothetical protein